jgi:hypothetical protein
VRLRHLVPWLAADGPLAYNPTKPPSKDYFFQYNWILPGIFNPAVGRRQRYYFGSFDKGAARFLFDFWSQARQGRGTELQIYNQHGLFSDTEVTVPIAAYRRRPVNGRVAVRRGILAARLPGKARGP